MEREVSDEDLLIPPEDEEELKEPEIVLYKRRWYILAVYCFVSATQGCVWNTWGPLTQSAKQVFGWGDGTIGLMTNWGPITYIVSTPLFTWLMDTKGLRSATLLSTFLIMAGAGMRCIPGEDSVRTILIHLGQMLNGLPGPLCMAAPALVSAVWFPVEQRTTATAIGAISAGFGVTAAFLVGPLLVTDLSNNHDNSTMYHNGFDQQNSIENEPFYDVHNSSQADIDRVRKQIDNYMYMSLGYCAALFLIVLVYFPDKPPNPPSVTAFIQRLDYISGIKSLFRNKKFWMIGMVYGISLGVYNCFATVIDILLNERNIKQEDAALIGLCCGIVGNVVALLFAYFADFFKRRMKLYILVFYIWAGASFLVCSISYSGWLIPFTKVTAYVVLLSPAISLTAATPLFFELSCEASYPVAEGITNGVTTWLNNFFGLIFLIILTVTQNQKDRSWMIWTMMVATVICIPFLLLFRVRFSRLDIDKPIENDRNSPSSVESPNSQPINT